MPLETEDITIPLAQGLDTKSDPKQLTVGKLARLENGSFGTLGKLRKVPGEASFATSWATGAAKMVAGLSSSRCVMADPTTLYERTSAGLGAAVGPFVRTKLRVKQAFRDSDGYLYINAAYSSATGNTIYTWVTQVGTSYTPHYAVIEEATGRVLARDYPGWLASCWLHPMQCVAVGNYFAFGVSTGTTLKFYYISAATPTDAPYNFYTVAGYSDAAGNSYGYDIAENPGQLQHRLAYTLYASRELYVASFSSSLFITATVLVEAVAGTLGIYPIVFGTSTKTYISWTANGAGTYFAVYDAALPASPLKSKTAYTGVTDAIPAGGVEIGGIVYSYLSEGTVAGNLTRLHQINNTTYAESGAVYLRSLIPIGRPFSYLSRPTFLGYYSENDHLQDTAFLVSGALDASITGGVRPNIVARALMGSAGIMMKLNALAFSATEFGYPVPVRRFLDGSYYGTGYSAAQLRFTMSDESAYHAQELSDVLHFSGGCVDMYDGQNLCEHGFHVYPWGVTVPGGAGSKTFQYTAVYEWTDATGRVHRSAPSPSATYKNNNAPDSTSVALTIPSLRLTSKPNSTTASGVQRSYVWVVVYRTLDSGGIFYRVGAVLNDPTADTVALTDTTSDSALAGNLQLYTTGGVLENIAPPAFLHMVQAHSRIYGINAENPYQIIYSKQAIQGLPVEFNDALVYSVDERGGECRALAALDEKVVIFKDRSIFYFVGQGPDSLGAQNDFSEAYLVSSDVGCDNPRSIVNLPAGIVFRSAKGWYLLDRSMVAQYIGDGAEAFNSYVASCAAVVPNSHQVRVGLIGTPANSPNVLTYDHLTKQWGTITTSYPPSGYAVVGGLLVWCATSALGAALVLKDDTTVYYGVAGTYRPLLWETGWISLAGVQGLQRLRHILLLGTWKSSHSLVVKIAYDFEESAGVPAWSQTVAFSFAVSPSGQYQVRVNLTRQKCEAVRLQVYDTSQAGTSESYDISALTFVVGKKRGAFQLPASKQS